MDKQEFVSVDGGIQRGDLILIVKPDDWAPLTHLSALAGVYDPIDSDSHWYLTMNPELRHIVDKTFAFWRNPTIELNKPNVGVHEFASSYYTFRYEACKHVQLLMKASDLERILRSYK